MSFKDQEGKKYTKEWLRSTKMNYDAMKKMSADEEKGRTGFVDNI